MLDRTSVRNERTGVAEHLLRVKHDENNFEVRKEHRYGRDWSVVGVIGGPTIYREL